MLDKEFIKRKLELNQRELERLQTKVPIKYRDTFLRLSDLGMYQREFAEAIAPSAGLRNALVHEYNNIDKAMLEKSIREAIQEYNDYAKYILDYLDKE